LQKISPNWEFLYENTPSGNPGLNTGDDDSGLKSDGICTYFRTQKPNFGYILESLAMEDVGIIYSRLVCLFFGYLVYFMAVWYIFGLFPPVLVCCAKTNLALLFKITKNVRSAESLKILVIKKLNGGCFRFFALQIFC
jgi:hypothetical protein